MQLEEGEYLRVALYVSDKELLRVYLADNGFPPWHKPRLRRTQ